MIVKTIFNLTMLEGKTLGEAKSACITSTIELASILTENRSVDYSIKDYETKFGMRISINPKNVIYEEAIPMSKCWERVINNTTEAIGDEAKKALYVIKTICFKVIKVGEYEYYCYSLTDREIER